ncbi:hypothetical protein M514_04015 [Trichuris suis]|uniref:Uncharacterized protein n=1 Tax=Trichuris suis TaxID=68888 RepID=A0A085NSV1_9BILA|nr:hypothetical protein M513_04015 [Trichuris suis]KFD72547.1 hypothetical protein M514_04015 [Trichuris suis]
MKIQTSYSINKKSSKSSITTSSVWAEDFGACIANMRIYERSPLMELSDCPMRSSIPPKVRYGGQLSTGRLSQPLAFAVE